MLWIVVKKLSRTERIKTNATKNKVAFGGHLVSISRRVFPTYPTQLKPASVSDQKLAGKEKPRRAVECYPVFVLRLSRISCAQEGIPASQQKIMLFVRIDISQMLSQYWFELITESRRGIPLPERNIPSYGLLESSKRKQAHMGSELNMLIDLGPYLGLCSWSLYLRFGIASKDGRR
jgi:hypothetical protein